MSKILHALDHASPPPITIESDMDPVVQYAIDANMTANCTDIPEMLLVVGEVRKLLSAKHVDANQLSARVDFLGELLGSGCGAQEFADGAQEFAAGAQGSAAGAQEPSREVVSREVASRWRRLVYASSRVCRLVIDPEDEATTAAGDEKDSD